MTIRSSPKPILRWAGSKRQILPKLVSLAPNFSGRYIEPFCGSACLFLALTPQRAVLSDINRHLISAYQSVKADPAGVASALSQWPADRDAYLAVRSTPVSGDPVFDAARFIYLNRYCFNGVYRENRNGEFNVPYGGYRTGQLPTSAELEHFSGILQGVDLQCVDFVQVLRDAVADDFVYLDPPYHYGDTRNRGEYGLGAFSDDDISRFVEEVSDASRRGVRILISYNRAPSLRTSLPGWTLTYATVRRSVAGFSAKRKSVREYQLRNY